MNYIPWESIIGYISDIYKWDNRNTNSFSVNFVYAFFYVHRPFNFMGWFKVIILLVFTSKDFVVAAKVININWLTAAIFWIWRTIDATSVRFLVVKSGHQVKSSKKLVNLLHTEKGFQSTKTICTFSYRHLNTTSPAFIINVKNHLKRVSFVQTSWCVHIKYLFHSIYKKTDIVPKTCFRSRSHETWVRKCYSKPILYLSIRKVKQQQLPRHQIISFPCVLLLNGKPDIKTIFF